MVHHQRERLENSAVHCLATGPREANASRTAAQRESAPQGMVHHAQAFPSHITQKKTRKFIACRSYFMVHHQRERLENSAVHCF